MEQKNFKRTTVTAALPYANGGVHIGHLAGVYVPADIYVRYLRLKKQDVVFIGGSDEHGVPVTIRAKKEGITVQEVVDRYHNLIKKSFEDFGISFDIYSRTTSPTHNKFASDFFRTLYDKGGMEPLAFCEVVDGIGCNEVAAQRLVEDGFHRFLKQQESVVSPFAAICLYLPWVTVLVAHEVKQTAYHLPVHVFQ